MGICVKQCDDDEVRKVIEAMGAAPQLAEQYILRKQKGEGIFLAAWKDGEPVGHVFLKWNPALPGEYATRVQGDFGDLENLFVAEKRRSKGIGSMIIQKAEEEARCRGVELLGLAVDPERNPRAHVLYLRHGFRDIGLAPFDASGTWMDREGKVHSYEEWCIYMTKKLDG